VAEEMGVAPHLAHVPARNEVQHAYSSHDKAKQVLGAGSRYALPEGLARMAAWVRRVGARSTPLFQNIEVAEKLPSVWLGKGGGTWSSRGSSPLS